MRVEASVGETDEPLVKPLLVGTALVTGYEKYRLPVRVKGERYAPNLAVPSEPEFLHVDVLRSLQRVHRGRPRPGPNWLSNKAWARSSSCKPLASF